ncbi:hypothetical protein AGMMS49944_28920 [Spirochaetia bacterium]|nr:hypothetical protein AGMMS49944_28920 [Spirochaetia bacterium]
MYADRIFTAQWTTGGGGTQYTVTYSTGSGSGDAPASQTVTAGTAITLPGQESMTAPSGQTFNGWQDDGGTAYSTGASYTVNANVTFTAQWTTGGGGTQYTITYSTGSGTGAAPASQTVTAGTAITLPGQGSMTAPSGQTFDGWQDDGGTPYSAGASYTVNANVTFTAQWTTGGGGGLVSDIDTNLLGTWEDNLGGTIITVTFGSDGRVTWGGSAGSSLNAVTTAYQGTGYQFVWIATGGQISYNTAAPASL